MPHQNLLIYIFTFLPAQANKQTNKAKANGKWQSEISKRGTG